MPESSKSTSSGTGSSTQAVVGSRGPSHGNAQHDDYVKALHRESTSFIERRRHARLGASLLASGHTPPREDTAHKPPSKSCRIETDIYIPRGYAIHDPRPRLDGSRRSTELSRGFCDNSCEAVRSGRQRNTGSSQPDITVTLAVESAESTYGHSGPSRVISPPSEGVRHVRAERSNQPSSPSSSAYRRRSPASTRSENRPLQEWPMVSGNASTKTSPRWGSSRQGEEVKDPKGKGKHRAMRDEDLRDLPNERVILRDSVDKHLPSTHIPKSNPIRMAHFDPDEASHWHQTYLYPVQDPTSRSAPLPRQRADSARPHSGPKGIVVVESASDTDLSLVDSDSGTSSPSRRASASDRLNQNASAEFEVISQAQSSKTPQSCQTKNQKKIRKTGSSLELRIVDGKRSLLLMTEEGEYERIQISSDEEEIYVSPKRGYTMVGDLAMGSHGSRKGNAGKGRTPQPPSEDSEDYPEYFGMPSIHQGSKASRDKHCR